MASQIVSLQVGQCGNQTGTEFFGTYYDEITRNASNVEDVIYGLDPFFHYDESAELHEARAVLIDMEPKVVRDCELTAVKSGKWQYRSGSSVCRQSGSGNNWAYGYHIHGEECKTAILDRVRRQVELCDALSGFVTLQSLAGGTGSGLGSAVGTLLMDEYRSPAHLHVAVWPYERGEVVVQNYNAVLSLAHLQENSDGVLLAYNDVLDTTCRQILQIQRPTFKDMNQVLAWTLAGTFLPSSVLPHPTTCSGIDDNGSDAAWNSPAKCSRWRLSDMVQQLCPHPGYRMLSVRFMPQVSQKAVAFSSFRWSSILQHIRQMLIANQSIDDASLNWHVAQPSKSLANWLTLRGGDIFPKPQRARTAKRTPEAQTPMRSPISRADVSAIADPALYTPWMRDIDERLVCSYSSSRFHAHEKSAVLVSNSQAIVAPLQRILSKMHDMLDVGAYTHHYEKFGCSAEEMRWRCHELSQTVCHYKSL